MNPASRARSIVVPTIASLTVVAFVAGCGGGTAGGGDDRGPAGSITVSVAASLVDAFEQLVDLFVAEHPDADAVLNAGSSGQLSEQVLGGAPVDVVALADAPPMRTLEDAGALATEPVEISRNRLVVVTPPGNPGGVVGLADLGRGDLGTVALCAEHAPCGTLASELLANAGVEVSPARVTRGQDVSATLGAVTRGDAAAAIVYASDAASAGDRVATVEVPEARDIVAVQQVAVTEGANAPELAAEFVRFVTDGEARAVLADRGFEVR